MQANSSTTALRGALLLLVVALLVGLQAGDLRHQQDVYLARLEQRADRPSPTEERASPPRKIAADHFGRQVSLERPQIERPQLVVASPPTLCGTMIAGLACLAHENCLRDSCDLAAGPSFEEVSLPAFAEIPAEEPLAMTPPPLLAGNVPVPHEIAAGRYRVVSSGGRVTTVTLTIDKLCRLGIGSSEPAGALYSVESGSCRWYFVRLDEPGAAQTVVRQDDSAPAIAEHPAATEPPWVPTLVDLAGRMRIDLRMAAWCWNQSCDKWQRQILARLRQSGSWAELMAEAIEQSLKRIEWSSRISAGEQGPRL